MDITICDDGFVAEAKNDSDFNVIENKEVKHMDEWFKAHNFPYIKAPNGSYFWQTQVITGELTPTNEIIFHHKNLFKEITEGYKNDTNEAI